MEKRVAESPKSHTDRKEQRLVDRLKSHSPGAFDELVGRYAGRLFSVAIRILRDPQDAEDCVQETFLKAFESISSFREQASLSTWLHRIATNQALSKLRRQRRNPVVAVETYPTRFANGDHASYVPDWNRLPEALLLRRELSDHLQRLVSELPQHYRVAYTLKDLEKLSEDEVSRTLGLPITTIKNRVHRARLVIRAGLEELLLGPASALPAERPFPSSRVESTCAAL